MRVLQRLLSVLRPTTSCGLLRSRAIRSHLFADNKISHCLKCRMASSQSSTTTSSGNLKPQQFDYLLVLDFEATCLDGTQINPQEIIELPVLKVNTKTLQTDAVFHQYVQPKVHRELSDFCIKLTGIMQDMVDDQPYLEDTLKSLDDWMQKNGLLDPNVKFLFVTCGDWDLNKMLPHQCEHFGIPIPEYFRRWLNIKKAFAEVTMTYPKGMMPMISQLGLTHTGRHHSGIG